MLTHQFIVSFLIAVTQLLTGILINGFIIVVNAVDFIRQRRIAPLDLIICCLVSSRICLQLLIFLTYLVHFSLMNPSVLEEISLIFVFINIWGHWLSTWLGVFYCAKIAAFPHPLFFWLRMRISKLVPWLILGSTLYASISSGIQDKHTWTMTQKYLVNIFSSNATKTKEVNIVPLCILIFHLTLPLIIFLITVLLLILSLGRHAQKMRTIATGTRDPRSGAPVKAMLSILSFLILHFSHYMLAVLFFSSVFQFGTFIFGFFTFLSGIYPSIHSVILILGNVKLKQNAKKYLFCGQYHQ
ncbi:taste receptor type 2 member 1-like [Octodon degus]|uniref:Taste receptor type 2 n=1 Tax=Octodon degus TaxID=10160 RepID=A0A6P3EKX8_OCTDE|nr:taste receptor type 2 member 1-like [Octodon degus]